MKSIKKKQKKISILGISFGILLLIITISFINLIKLLNIIPNKYFNLGIGIISIYIVVLITRQLLEPKIVSNQIGIHPIFTLISMYAGFKIIGILGLIIGPIILIIYKNVFESLLERGLVKTIFERE